MRGTLLERLARRRPAMADAYRVALARIDTPDGAEALMHALCEDIARCFALPAPGPGPDALRDWLWAHVLRVEVEQHMLRNAGYYIPLMRRSP